MKRMSGQDCLSWAPVLVFSVRFCQLSKLSQMDAVGHRYLLKPGCVPRNPLDLVAVNAKRFAQQSLPSFCRLPNQGMESRQYGWRRFILKLNIRGLQQTQRTEMIQYVERRNTYIHSNTQANTGFALFFKFQKKCAFWRFFEGCKIDFYINPPHDFLSTLVWQKRNSSKVRI